MNNALFFELSISPNIRRTKSYQELLKSRSLLLHNMIMLIFALDWQSSLSSLFALEEVSVNKSKKWDSQEKCSEKHKSRLEWVDLDGKMSDILGQKRIFDL